MRTRITLSLLQTSAIAALLFVAGRAGAQGTTIVDAGGFESGAGYSTTFLGTGQLEGQPLPQPWLRTVGGTSTAVVQNTVVAFGSQAVQVDRGASSDARWAVPLFGWPSQPIVVLDWNMRVAQTPGPSGSFGPFFGAEAYDTDGIGSGVGLFGSLGVDATTGDVLYQDQGTGFLTESGATVPFDQWNHFRIILNFTFDTYSVYLNNNLLTTTGFVDGAAGLDQLTDADISTFAAAGDPTSQGLPGQAFYDDFLVRQYPNLAAVPPATLIPEPGACLLAGVGLLAIVRRRLG